MKTENNQENLSGGQQSRTKDGALGDDRSKGADFAKEPEAAAARDGVPGDDRSKTANVSSEPEAARTRGGAAGDDRSKRPGDSNDLLEG